MRQTTFISTHLEFLLKGQYVKQDEEQVSSRSPAGRKTAFRNARRDTWRNQFLLNCNRRFEWRLRTEAVLRILGFDFKPLEDTFYRPRIRLVVICRLEHRSWLILTGPTGEWKQLHLDSFARSRDIFDRIRANPMNRLEELLPGNWKGGQRYPGRSVEGERIKPAYFTPVKKTGVSPETVRVLL